MGSGKLGAAMDEGELSGEVKGHPGGGDLSRLALREL